MVAVIAATLAGWLCVFLILLADPRSGRQRPGGRARLPPRLRDEPPAVVSLLARRLRADGYQATLLDLALRAGVHGSLPAPAMSEGFEGGEDEFMKAFGREVVADARDRRLTRPRLGARSKVLLCALALIPAAASITLHSSGGSVPIACFGILVLITVANQGERLTPAGRTALAHWRAIAAPPADMTGSPGGQDRRAAYAAALGEAPAAAVAGLARTGSNGMWSSYGGTWRQVTIGDPNERQWPVLYPFMTLMFSLFLAVVGYGFIRGVGGAAVGVASVAGGTLFAARAIARSRGFPGSPSSTARSSSSGDSSPGTTPSTTWRSTTGDGLRRGRSSFRTSSTRR